MGKKKKKSETPATARNPFGIATVSNRPHGAYEPGGKMSQLELMRTMIRKCQQDDGS